MKIHAFVDEDFGQEPPLRPPMFSDDALALRFADQHVDDLRYVSEWSKWQRWNGTRWQFDDTLAASDSARMICREAAAECNKGKLAKELASAKTVAAIERLTRSDRRLAASVDQWDAEPWLLNTPKGVIDLRTGIMHKHRAADYLTCMTAVAPEGDCPLWRAFLDRTTAGDTELQAYVQRLCGHGEPQAPSTGLSWFEGTTRDRADRHAKDELINNENPASRLRRPLRPKYRPIMRLNVGEILSAVK